MHRLPPPLLLLPPLPSWLSCKWSVPWLTLPLPLPPLLLLGAGLLLKLLLLLQPLLGPKGGVEGAVEHGDGSRSLHDLRDSSLRSSLSVASASGLPRLLPPPILLLLLLLLHWLLGLLNGLTVRLLQGGTERAAAQGEVTVPVGSLPAAETGERGPGEAGRGEAGPLTGWDHVRLWLSAALCL